VRRRCESLLLDHYGILMMIYDFECLEKFCKFYYPLFVVIWRNKQDSENYPIFHFPPLWKLLYTQDICFICDL
jgi:hypothetical protein